MTVNWIPTPMFRVLGRGPKANTTAVQGSSTSPSYPSSPSHRKDNNNEGSHGGEMNIVVPLSEHE
jgi:hypothetical protein